MLNKMTADQTLVLRELRQLKYDVAEVAKEFPTAKAVCYKLEDNTFYVDFYAPKMGAEEHFELTKAMLELEAKCAFIDVDFHTTCLPLNEYAMAGFRVVKSKPKQT